MSNKVVNWPIQAGIPANVTTGTATVTQAENGSALRIQPEDGSGELLVDEHLTTVPSLQQGDRVRFTRDTGGKVYIDGMLRNAGEPPAAMVVDRGGAVELQGARSLQLEAGESKIELTADGRIKIDGKDVYAVASASFSLAGATVKIN